MSYDIFIQFSNSVFIYTLEDNKNKAKNISFFSKNINMKIIQTSNLVNNKLYLQLCNYIIICMQKLNMIIVYIWSFFLKKSNLIEKC